ncbi:hypothetical protein [Kosakonia phage Kc237]|nr:hypothetical protein [Kosakonia phage Kc237]
MAKLTVRINNGQERGRQWNHHFKATADHATVKRYLGWKSPVLVESDDAEEYVDEFTTRGELEASRIIHRNKMRAAEYY